MGASFSDISLYVDTGYSREDPLYWSNVYLMNYVSDLYVRCMDGYKPPRATRITIQPAFYGKWDAPWRSGSIIHIAPFFDLHKYQQANQLRRHHIILDLIQSCTSQLSHYFDWDHLVFKRAYEQVLAFSFRFEEFGKWKLSPDRKMSGRYIIRKDMKVTSFFVEIAGSFGKREIELFQKPNSYWYDAVYILAKKIKWIGRDSFGVSYADGKLSILYLIQKHRVDVRDDGNLSSDIDFSNYFNLQLNSR